MKFTKGEMFVITGMAEMVENEGKTPREVLERVREIEKLIYFSLMDIKKESEVKS